MMGKKEIKKYCSKIADYYFNTRYIKFRKGEITGSYIVHTEIEKLCKKGIRKVPIKELIQILTTKYPEKENHKNRVNEVIKFSKNPPKDKALDILLEEEDGIITIIPVDNEDND
jgi:hypothetical protein